MKVDFVADTNFLIYVHEGDKFVEPFLEYNFGISFISEIELLGFSGLTISEEKKLKSLLADCFLIEWNNTIKEKTIELIKKYGLKIPDAIIAASGIWLNVPLVTADKGFSKIKELDLILLEI